MKKILFFPFLRMPSGHHQVADTISGYMKKRDSQIVCKKIDLLSEWNPIVESIVTRTYLEWIQHLPKNYAWVYKQMAYTSKTKRSYKFYELLFVKKMEKIIAEENPNLLICTHGFPSYILSKLKTQNQCQIPVINVYTDFFINDVWGRDGIDYHFVPNQIAKNTLVDKNGISEDRILVTGIPTAETFEEPINKHRAKKPTYKVLVSGGSVGLGNITDLLKQKGKAREIEYFVLCGSNKQLYKNIKKLNDQNIYPLPYLSSREKMNELYSMVDGIITKPGGVTISEALKKGLPIFIHSALPGQEEINLNLLKELKLVQELHDEQPLEYQITSFFKNKRLTSQFNDSLQDYQTEIESGKPAQIAKFISSLIGSDKETAIKRIDSI